VAPSSIRAVLARREELRLEEAQVARLSEIQADLDREDAELRDRFVRLASRRGASRSDANDGAPQGSAPRRRGRRAEPAGERATGRADGAAPRSTDDSVEHAFEDADTRAFLRAEPVFTQAQWERAREIAERYREDFEDARRGGAQRR
jgi:hypothetical protein